MRAASLFRPGPILFTILLAVNVLYLLATYLPALAGHILSWTGAFLFCSAVISLSVFVHWHASGLFPKWNSYAPLGWLALSIASAINLSIYLHDQHHKSRKLYVITSQAGEELRVFQDVLDDFERLTNTRVRVLNMTWSKALRYLDEQQPADLLVFDVTWREELLRATATCPSDRRHAKPLLQPLDSLEGVSSWETLGPQAIPSSVLPAIRPSLFGSVGRRSSPDPLATASVHESPKPELYFLPYRVNVKLTFVNRKAICPESSPDSACTVRSWNDLISPDIASKLEGRVALQFGQDDDKALFLLEFLRSAGLPDFDIMSEEARRSMRLLHDLHAAVDLPDARYDTVSGLLLTGRAYFSRNWTFTLHFIHRAGRENDFAVLPGLPLRHEGPTPPGADHFSNLLGGDLLAIPTCATNTPGATRLISYLLSRRVQEQIVRDLAWPAMRLDAVGDVPEWLQKHQQVVRRALENARPSPPGWTRQIAHVYARLFDGVTRGCPTGEGEGDLASCICEQACRRTDQLVKVFQRSQRAGEAGALTLAPRKCTPEDCNSSRAPSS